MQALRARICPNCNPASASCSPVPTETHRPSTAARQMQAERRTMHVRARALQKGLGTHGHRFDSRSPKATTTTTFRNSNNDYKKSTSEYIFRHSTYLLTVESWLAPAAFRLVAPDVLSLAVLAESRKLAWRVTSGNLFGCCVAAASSLTFRWMPAWWNLQR